MQRFIEFFELNKDGTWFVVLIFVLAVIAVALLVHYGRYEILNIKFYRKYGITLSKYCKKYDISDYGYAFEDAARKKEYKKTVANIQRNDLLIVPYGVTIEQACDAIMKFQEVLSANDIREQLNLTRVNGGL